MADKEEKSIVQSNADSWHERSNAGGSPRGTASFSWSCNVEGGKKGGKGGSFFLAALFGVPLMIFMFMFMMLLMLFAGVVFLFGGRRIAAALFNRALNSRKTGFGGEQSRVDGNLNDDPDVIDVEGEVIDPPNGR